MIRVRAPSRLHFGLLNVGGGGEPGGTARRFGGVGLMVEVPGLRLYATPAAAWSAQGPLAERALAFAHRFVQTLGPGRLAPQCITVEQAPPEHVGLGTGTQLALSVARALAVAAGLPHLGAATLGGRVGRGLRSGLGVHGFAHGGFLVDGGKGGTDTLAPLVARIPFPQAWRVVLVLPPWGPGLHGYSEREAFAALRDQDTETKRTETLCRLALLGMLPALAEQDLEAFGEALHEFNRRAGEASAAVQGGTYLNPRVADLVNFVYRQGVRGVGQSSWGPGVFAVVGDDERAESLAYRIRDRFALTTEQVLITRASNVGAVTEGDGAYSPFV